MLQREALLAGRLLLSLGVLQGRGACMRVCVCAQHVVSVCVHATYVCTQHVWWVVVCICRVCGVCVGVCGVCVGLWYVYVCRVCVMHVYSVYT